MKSFFAFFRDIWQFFLVTLLIQCEDSNPRHLKHELAPITTRPGRRPCTFAPSCWVDEWPASDKEVTEIRVSPTEFWPYSKRKDFSGKNINLWFFPSKVGRSIRDLQIFILSFFSRIKKTKRTRTRQNWSSFRFYWFQCDQIKITKCL